MNSLSKVKIKWSSNFSYAIGLLATDGCLYNDRRHMSFTSKDKALASTFKKCLGLHNKIGLKSSGSSKRKYFHVQFGDVSFYKWLNKIGLNQKKSKIIGKIIVPDRYYKDFLRGCFDGDGSFFSVKDKRWRNSIMFYTSFTSASLKFLDWLRERNMTLFGIKGFVCKAGGGRTHDLRYAKTESIVLLKKLYYKKSLPCLVRKRENVIKYICL